MKLKAIYLISIIALLISQSIFTDYSSNEETVEFINYMSEKHGYDETYLNSIFKNAEYQDKVVRIMNKQPEGTMTWERYKGIMVNDSRISAGKEFIGRFAEDLKRAEKIYGVPAEIIASIIGIETRYGRIKGNMKVIDSLSTLAFDYPRRSKFFKIQLEEFLLLSREENFNPETIKGSIAGAMGYGQFMPDSYRDYAVDFDNDGVRDILNNPVDAIGSVANFLNKKGKWKPNTPVAIKAYPLEEIKPIKSSFKPYMTSIELEKFGLATKEAIPNNLKFVPLSLDLSQGYEYWLGFDNYQSISRYNRSKLYVMAVFEFSNALSQFLK
jgi:membrane-bound lytic murein transglycosylase B